MRKFKLIKDKEYNITFTCDDSTAFTLAVLARTNLQENIIYELNKMIEIPQYAKEVEDILSNPDKYEIGHKFMALAIYAYNERFLAKINSLLLEWQRLNPLF